MALPAPDSDLIDRFKRDLHALVDVPGCCLGVAVSGGPDSLALLLLAAAAYPGQIEAATVDHGLRAESPAEARLAAAAAERLGVPHAILQPLWAEPPAANVAATARSARYDALCGWGAERRLMCVLTAHHMDDQAETLLMRAARGSGLSGLAGVRPVTEFAGESGDALLVRPLLGWRKTELEEVAAAAGLVAAADPTNDDARLDRTHARRLLRDTPWLEPSRLAACASHVGEAEAALRWVAEREFRARSRTEPDGKVTLRVLDLPRELQRRLLRHALALFIDIETVPGPKVETLLDTLLAGGTGTLGEALVRPGPPWRVELAPPRRR